MALLFYFFVVGLLAEGRGHRLHPLSWFLIGCAFFADHLLFAYLADHVPLWLALTLSSAVSILLAVTYAQWLVGWRFALREMGLAQLVYLVGFSLTFLLKGFTGLSITVGAILTLFMMMQVTGRRLRGRRAPGRAGGLTGATLARRAGRPVGLLGRSYREHRLVRAELRVTPWVAEFWNTLSSLAMVVAGLVGLSLRRHCARKFRFAFGLLALVGLGSVAFHGTLRFELQMLDELPMLYLVTWLVWLLVETGPAPRLGRWFPAALVGLRAARHCRGDAQPRRRAVPRLPRQLRRAGDLLPRAGDLARPASREPAGTSVVHARARGIRDGNRALVPGSRGLPPGEREACCTRGGTCWCLSGSSCSWRRSPSIGSRAARAGHVGAAPAGCGTPAGRRADFPFEEPRWG